MIKLGLLGVGKMGQNHLKNIISLPCYELSFIYDYDSELCARLASEHGTKASLDLQSDLASINAAIIATPTFTHDEYIKKVSKFTKNIFVEKPLCDSFEKCEQIKTLAQNLGLNIAVGFIERFNPALIELKNELKKLDKNTKIHEVKLTRTSLASSRITDVDVITDLMIHDIDLALYLNGDAQYLSANGVIQNGAIDLATATLKHENGVISLIHASRITHKNERKISISTSEAHFECDLLAKNLCVFKNAEPKMLEAKEANALKDELVAFSELCTGQKAKELADAKAATNAMKIAADIAKIIKNNNSEF